MGILLNTFTVSAGQESNYERLKKNIGTLTIDVTLYPTKTGQKYLAGGLQSVLLHTSNTILLEPAARWRNGTPVSVAAKISKQNMLGVTNQLQRLGILQRAKCYYSAARPNPMSKLPTGEEFTPYGRIAQASCEITATYTSGDYHSYVVCRVPLGKETLKTLNCLNAYAPKSVLNQLQETCKRFQ
jgi:hypothetical protein